MFFVPRTWTNGESGIRSDSLNKSLPDNLEAFRSLMKRRVVVSTRENKTINIQRVPADQIYAVSSYCNFDSTFIPEPNPGVFGTGMTTRVEPTFNPSAVAWVPFASINAAKKSSENIYFQVFLRFFFGPKYPDVYSTNYSLVEYEYIGSDVHSKPSTNVSKIAWSPALSNTSGTTISLVTEETPIDTSAMINPSPSIAAFKFRFKQYGMPEIYGDGFAGTDRVYWFQIRVDLVVK